MALSDYEKDQAELIEIAVMNEYEIYKNLMAFNENYTLKRKRGTFDRKLAVKGLLNVVKRAITFINKSRYWDNIGTVNAKTKEAVARELFRSLWEDHGLRNVRKAVKRPRKR